MALYTRLILLLLPCGCVLSVRLHAQEACPCLNFKTAYDKKLVGCGAANEKTSEEWACEWFGAGMISPDSPGIVGVGKNFLKHDHSYCVEIQRNDGRTPKTKEGTWCYVSASCTELNGGQKVNDFVSWKNCTQADRALGDMRPAELYAFAKKTGLDFQDIFMMAYKWVGPHDGNIMSMAVQEPHKPILGASPKPDTFAVRYMNEVWEVNDNVACVKGCAA